MVTESMYLGDRLSTVEDVKQLSLPDHNFGESSLGAVVYVGKSFLHS